MLMPRKTSAAAFDNVLCAHYERMMRAPRVTSRPFVLLLDPASVCQLQCPMCPTGIENASRASGRGVQYRERGLLSPERFEAIVQELHEHLFFVHLYNWGEPLLNPHLTRFIQALVERDITVDTNTNLSFPLSEVQLNALIESGIHRIEASIDGFSAESYGRYRRKGRFELARDNLVRLARTRDRLGAHTQIVWNFLIFRTNEHEVEAARNFCHDQGIEFVPRNSAVTAALREEFLPSARAGEVLEGFAEHCARPFEAEAIDSRSLQSCAWHYFYSVINADGSVSPCCAPWESDWDYGQIIPGETRFSQIWNGEAIRAGRADVAGTQLLQRLRRSGELQKVQTVGDFVARATLCEGCQMPVGMLDLYSDRVEAIIRHYFATPQVHDRRRDRLFSLLSGAGANPQRFRRWYAHPGLAGRLYNHWCDWMASPA